MITPHCAVCGTLDGVENHHFIPKSLGGGDEDTNMLSLCYTHHGFIHGVEKKVSSSYLMKKTKSKMISDGKYTGGAIPFAKKVVERNGVKYLDWDENELEILKFILKNKYDTTYIKLQKLVKEKYDLYIVISFLHKIFWRYIGHPKFENNPEYRLPLRVKEPVL